jgi:Kef-type K+ transport system membrane component KefB
LFVAGLEMTFRDFRKVGTAGFVIGTVGVIVPFIMGYGLSWALGYGTIVCLVVGAALVATSISITAIVLQEINRTKHDKEPPEAEQSPSDVDTSAPDYMPTYPLNFS